MSEEVMIGTLPGSGYSARILVHDPVENIYAEERVPVEYWKVNQISIEKLEIVGITVEDQLDTKEEKDLSKFKGFMGYTGYPLTTMPKAAYSTTEETTTPIEEATSSPTSEEIASDTTIKEEATQESASFDGEVKGEEEVKKSDIEADTADTDKLVGIQEASQIAGMQPYQLRYAVRHNNLEGKKAKNNRWVFNRDKLILWKEDMKQREKADVPRRGRRRKVTA